MQDQGTDLMARIGNFAAYCGVLNLDPTSLLQQLLKCFVRTIRYTLIVLV